MNTAYVPQVYANRSRIVNDPRAELPHLLAIYSRIDTWAHKGRQSLQLAAFHKYTRIDREVSA
jgi:hypothetical protein